jgi:indolepyruvate decarboxylase
VKPQALSATQRTEPLSVNHFFTTLEACMPEDSTLVCDVGDALIGAIGIRTGKRHTFLADAYYLSMGFAVPAAIGALAGNHDGRVFAVVGDGAFQMTGVELSTAAKFGLAPIVLVMNNDGYGTQRHIIDGPFNEIQRWQYHKMPEMLGAGTGVRVTNAAELEAALKQAVTSPTLTLIEAIIPRDSCSDQLRRLGEGLSAQRDSSKRKP